jgi:hypothetical protein
VNHAAVCGYEIKSGVSAMWTCPKCKEEIEASFDSCWNCGTDTEGTVNPEFQTAEQLDSKSLASSAISRVCPTCGSDSYTTTRPKGWVTYSEDRICKSCNTRYSPPTPLWAAVLLSGLGGVLTFGCVASLAMRFTSRDLTSLAGVVPEAVLGIIGVAAIKQGLRARQGVQSKRQR